MQVVISVPSSSLERRPRLCQPNGSTVINQQTPYRKQSSARSWHLAGRCTGHTAYGMGRGSPMSPFSHVVTAVPSTPFRAVIVGSDISSRSVPVGCNFLPEVLTANPRHTYLPYVLCRGGGNMPCSSATVPASDGLAADTKKEHRHTTLLSNRFPIRTTSPCTYAVRIRQTNMELPLIVSGVTGFGHPLQTLPSSQTKKKFSCVGGVSNAMCQLAYETRARSNGDSKS
ncbi:hypothetical protein B0T14DRAFT_219676 [Immersiella caudata]|uniref:Uncharacterized protein n=1 Tax=Immersiella caudata TaxID=314043 RepID=A0AA39WQU8_9PEZI|nr:hypothetical protein B0T14DRAFT_219676 [Immersiella caudata]